jgi:hypothetical protein
MTIFCGVQSILRLMMVCSRLKCNADCKLSVSDSLFCVLDISKPSPVSLNALN